MSGENKMKAPFGYLLLILVIAAAAYALFSYLQGRGISAKNGWLFDLSGYEQALQEAKRSQQPVLLYLRKKSCHSCSLFEKEYLNAEHAKALLSSFTKVQIYSDANKAHQRLTKRLAPHASPSLFVLFDDAYPVSTYLILENSQIWVTQPKSDTGNFMYLSPASFQLALTNAVEKAKSLASKAQVKPKEPN